MPRASSSTARAGQTRKGGRLTREQWLQRSMRLLEKRGPGAMTLESLTRHLGVTTGSFYWHFKSHSGFLDALTDKFIDDYTAVVVERLASLEESPREKLVIAMRMIVETRLGAMDLHCRSLAVSFPRLARKITAMDRQRTEAITSLFKDMGYRGPELRMRVHNFLVLNSMEHAMGTGLSEEELLQLFDERVKLLID